MTLTAEQLAASAGNGKGAPTIAPHAKPVTAENLYAIMSGNSTEPTEAEKKFWTDLAQGKAWATDTLVNLLKLVNAANDDRRNAVATRLRSREKGLRSDMHTATVTAVGLGVIDIAWLYVNFAEAYTRFNQLQINDALLFAMSGLVIPAATLLAVGVSENPVMRSAVRFAGRASAAAIAVSIGIFLVSQVNKIPLEENREGFQLILDILARNFGKAADVAQTATDAAAAVAPKAPAVVDASRLGTGEDINLDAVLGTAGPRAVASPSAAINSIFSGATPEAAQSALRIISGYVMFGVTSLGISIATALKIVEAKEAKDLLYGTNLPAGSKGNQPAINRTFAALALGTKTVIVGGVTYAALQLLGPEATMATKALVSAPVALAYLFGELSMRGHNERVPEPLVHLREDLANLSSKTLMLRMGARVTQVLKEAGMDGKVEEFQKAITKMIGDRAVLAKDEAYLRIADPKLADEMTAAIKAYESPDLLAAKDRLAVEQMGLSAEEARVERAKMATAAANAVIAASARMEEAEIARGNVADAALAATQREIAAAAEREKLAALQAGGATGQPRTPVVV